MDISHRLLQLLLARQYQLSDHAFESLDDDDLSLNDVISCFASGRLRRSWPKQRKYEIEGDAVDGRSIRVVARLIRPDLTRIITVYEVR